MYMWADINAIVSIVADWASLLSLGISTFAAVTIVRVRREVLGRVTLPDLVMALQDSNNHFATLLSDYVANERLFSLELARCEANIRALVEIRNSAAPRAKAMLSMIAEFRRLKRGRSGEEDDGRHAWDIYSTLNGLIEELKRVQALQQIGG